MHVDRLPAFSTNYLFLLRAGDGTAAVVDPGDGQPVLARLRELGLDLTTIFITHHHSDHVGGNRMLLQHFPHATVYGSKEDRDRIPGLTTSVGEGDAVEFGGRAGAVLFVPGHTRGHIAYYFPATGDEPGELFVGDTLFAGGCGRLMEGTPAQMVESLSRLRDLPDDTRIWCAHEYTLKNLRFALTVDGSNPDLQARFVQVRAARDRGEPTVPTVLSVEKRTNPFLRWDEPALQTATGQRDPVRTFGKLRGMKDLF